MTRSGPIEAWIVDDTGFAKKGVALGRRRASVLRAARQAGELSGRGDTVDCQSRWPACRWRIGCICRTHGPRTMHAAPRCACPTRSSSRPNRRSHWSRYAGRAKFGLPRGVGLMDAAYGNYTTAARRHDGPGRALCGRHFAEYVDVAIRDRPAAERQTTQQYGPPRPARPGLGQGSGDWSAEAGLAHGQVAGRLSGAVVFALRACARSVDRDTTNCFPRSYRGSGCWSSGPREKPSRPNTALDVAGDDQLPAACRFCQAALAHRARLSGAQAGGRSWSLRGTWLARLPSSRHDVHRGLRILVAERATIPLRTSFRRAVPDASPSRELSTQRIRPCGLSATSRIRSRPCADASSTLSLDACHDVRAVAPQPRDACV